MYAPVVFWKRKDKAFYGLEDYTADQIFRVSGRDDLDLITWPELQPVTVSLDALKPAQISKLSAGVPSHSGPKR